MKGSRKKRLPLSPAAKSRRAEKAAERNAEIADMIDVGAAGMLPGETLGEAVERLKLKSGVIRRH